jgi:hypothetical protein
LQIQLKQLLEGQIVSSIAHFEDAERVEAPAEDSLRAGKIS